MSPDSSVQPPSPQTEPRALPLAALLRQQPARQPAIPEIGGRTDGPEPTRYGDWEKNGRCIDF
ncbi:DUF1674 domain-containing protein [Sinimarinibacterium thermocellulolyticum]